MHPTQVINHLNVVPAMEEPPVQVQIKSRGGCDWLVPLLKNIKTHKYKSIRILKNKERKTITFAIKDHQQEIVTGQRWFYSE